MLRGANIFKLRLGLQHKCWAALLASTILTTFAYAGESITITPTTVAFPAPGVSFSQTLTATGGTGPYNWQIVTEPMPPGSLSITLNGSTLSGTPTAAGSFSATVEVTDNNGNSAIQAISLQVNYSGTVVTSANSSLPAGMAIINISAAECDHSPSPECNAIDE